MRLTCITCACHRPEAWALSEKYMARQTVQPFQHLVLDDDDPPTVCTMGQQYIRVPKVEGLSSLCAKLDYVIKNNLIGGDAVVFWENDDWMAPNWLEFCAEQLKYYDLIGEGRAIYYNVKGRWWYGHDNMFHASLCSTAMKKSLLPVLLQASQSKNPFVDARLWRDVTRNKMVFDPIKMNRGKRMVVGIKAMPGRVGYGGGHAVKDVSAKADDNMDKLKELIGDDYKNYERFKMNGDKHITETSKAHGANWLKWLAHLVDKPDVKGLEIGTFRGESAEFFCEQIFTHPTSKYFCVDPFTGNLEHAIGGVDCTTLEKDSRERLKGFPQCEIIKDYSFNVLKKIEPSSLDFIYCDGAHDSMNVLRDSVMGFEALKPGGIFVWDDFEWVVINSTPQDMPKIAIQSFLECYKNQIEVLEPRGWQICCKKL